MENNQNHDIDTEGIKEILDQYKSQMKLYLRVCAHCSLCADSCFLYKLNDRDPRYMPSHKFINSIGKLYKKRGKADREDLEEIKEIAWRRCVLCMRCYCPFGLDIPKMIALARRICRSQGVFYEYDQQTEL